MKIAIASGKGGTGKTTIATNLFEALRMQGQVSVELIDTDVEEPNAHIFIGGGFEVEPEKHQVEVRVPVFDSDKCTFCGRCVYYCEYDAILMVKENSYIDVIDDLCKSCGACIYSCNDGAITEKKKSLGEISVFQTEQARFVEGRLNIGSPFSTPLIQAAKALKDTNSISIIDSAPGTSNTTVESIYDADFVIVVSEPSPFGLNDLKLMIATLDHLRKDYAVVINRFHGEYNKVHEYLKEKDITLLMEIPFKRDYAKWYSQGKLLVREDDELRKEFVQLFDKVKDIYLQKSIYR